uniref:TIL domain-containing protein n=1 Tax=Steinernema glaseri TaxID=37863 RepID=A0A1I7YTV1_9BILA
MKVVLLLAVLTIIAITTAAPPKKKCGANEVWDECPRCLNTCFFRLSEAECGKKCKPAQCVCKKGYLRDTGSTVDQPCVLVAHCPTLNPISPELLQPIPAHRN